MSHRPITVPMLAELVRGAAADGQTVLVHGGRTKLGWLNASEPAIDVCIDLGGLSGVVAHDHGDMTATVHAGTPLVALQRALAARGQRLAIDPPLGPDAAATVGGIFSTNDSGPGRLAYGSLRELCIGASFMLADGTQAKSGSKVIKNVAGYDLCKLLCGARGTLAVVTQLTVRLHPIPAAETTVRAAMPLGEAAPAAIELADAVDADGVTFVLGEGHAGELWVRFSGNRGLVQAQARRAEALVRAAGGELRERLDDDASRSAWVEATEQRRARPGETTVAVTVPARGFAGWAAAHADWMAETGVWGRLVADPLLGLALIHLPPAGDHAAAVPRLRSTAAAHRGHARLRDRAPGRVDRVDPFGPLPNSLPVMQRVKTALDPEGRLAPNRYLTHP